MIKILIIALIIFLAYWLGRQSVLGRIKKPDDDNKNLKDDVIDIDTED